MKGIGQLFVLTCTFSVSIKVPQNQKLKMLIQNNWGEGEVNVILQCKSSQNEAVNTVWIRPHWNTGFGSWKVR